MPEIGFLGFVSVAIKVTKKESFYKGSKKIGSLRIRTGFWGTLQSVQNKKPLGTFLGSLDRTGAPKP